jgi:hypothetical protein
MDGGLNADHGQPLLVALPFEAIGDGADPLVAEDLYESVCSELTRFRSLTVISPTSTAVLAEQRGAVVSPHESLRRAEDVDLFLEPFGRIGAGSLGPTAPRQLAALLRTGSGWIVELTRKRALLPQIKGLAERAQLEPHGGEFHCLDLAGRGAEMTADAVLDERGRTLLKARMRDLQDDLAESGGGQRHRPCRAASGGVFHWRFRGPVQETAFKRRLG